MLFPDSVYTTLTITETYKDGKCILKMWNISILQLKYHFKVSVLLQACQTGCGLILSRDRTSGQLSVHQKHLIYHFYHTSCIVSGQTDVQGKQMAPQNIMGGGDEEQF